MTVKAKAQFSDPGAILVTMTLSGSLQDFEQLQMQLAQGRVEYWRVSSLIDQIAQASSRLRRVAEAHPPAARGMVAADIGFSFHRERRS